MRAFDFSPLFRSTVGFDRMYRLLDSALQNGEVGQTYPPYNIVTLGEDKYRITMAVAGFTEQDLDVTQVENSLIVKGKSRKDEDGDVRYLHRGIGARSFEHRFQLADHIQVTGAALKNGLLEIELVRRVPEAMKPRSIAIQSVEALPAAANTAEITAESTEVKAA